MDGHDHSSSPWNHQWHREVGGVEEVWGVSEEVCAQFQMLRGVVPARPYGRPRHAGWGGRKVCPPSGVRVTSPTVGIRPRRAPEAVQQELRILPHASVTKLAGVDGDRGAGGH